ncbi:hypothetical protein LTR78_000310 [Recurvomyces mirabilis]|uniref:Plasma membrane proteolipid 3 n=1 Tax=Recurvomyces mirabilis TaxID=574656 RepID=A0AAE0WXR7_9PEZI|nr:hypothetical protein LTR78_000310 [Recurvomyces mirabilis]KAK5161965.1 hypothetical protein LTS14_000311 [Recurvomyces mirabilis]
MINVILLVIITIFIPPVGVFLIKGCGADLLINIALTLLVYFPGHIHAFYLEYKHFHRQDQMAQTTAYNQPPPQAGYGTVH